VSWEDDLRAAVARAREIEVAAAHGWPSGYDQDHVSVESLAALEGILGAISLAPAKRQAEAAKRAVEGVYGKQMSLTYVR
jgi:hypothetical protein